MSQVQWWKGVFVGVFMAVLLVGIGCESPPETPAFGDSDLGTFAHVNFVASHPSGHVNSVRRVKHPGVSILFSSLWSDDPVPQGTATSFSLSSTDDLVQYIYMANWPRGVYVVWMRYRIPSGTIYEANPVAFAIGPTNIQFVQIEGLLTPVQVLPTNPTPLGHRFEVILPIAGTQIPRLWWTGTWSVEIIPGNSIPDDTSQPIKVAHFDFTD